MGEASISGPERVNLFGTLLEFTGDNPLIEEEEAT